MTWKAWCAGCVLGTLLGVVAVRPPAVEAREAPPRRSVVVPRALPPEVVVSRRLLRLAPRLAALPPAVPVADDLLDVLDARGEGLLRGEVVDAEGFPVDEELRVECRGLRHRPRVDASGGFRLPAPAGDCAVSAGEVERQVAVRPGEETEVRLVLQAERGSIGALVVEHAYGAEVLRVQPGSPAEQAGLEAGDVVLEVDGLSASDLPVWEIVDLVSGPPGTLVELVVGWEGPGGWVEEPVLVERAAR